MHGHMRQDASGVYRHVVNDRPITKIDACEAYGIPVALPVDVQAHFGQRATSVASKLDHGFWDTVAFRERREPGAAVALDVSVGKNRTHDAIRAITLSTASSLKKHHEGP